MNKLAFGIWDDKVYDCTKGEYLNLAPIETLEAREPGEKILAIMGWDGFFVFDPEVDLIDMARAYVEVVQRESCGKCVPCRMGSKVVIDILTRITEGKGKEGDLDTLRKICQVIKFGSMCELGHSSMNALIALMEHYEDRFRETITSGRRHEKGTYLTKVTAPCIEACPERLDIPSYIELIRSGRYTDSLSVIQEKNPLASVCGRVCVRFCEFACRRGKLDAPVDIKHLKRFVSDAEMEAAVKKTGKPEVLFTEDAKRVAIIGAGPAGITAAYHLLQKGYRVEIFEALDEPGGMAAVGIPDYRLPRPVLRSEIEVIQKMGAAINYKQALGKDFTLTDLKNRGFDAVFIAIGAHKGLRLGIKGEDLSPKGYLAGVAFLRLLNRNEAFEMGKRVVVVGGGNVAMDCARSSRRMGSEEVHLIYRRTIEEMPADKVEIHEAEEEGIRFHLLTNPTRLIIEDGTITGVECIRMKLGEPDAGGRRRPVPIEGSEFVIECDMVIPAIGQAVDISCVGEDCTLDVTRWNTLSADPDTLQTSVEWIFSGGDCISGPASLIEAMAAGLRGSNSIHQYLTEGRVTLAEDEWMSRIFRAMTAVDEDEVDSLGRGEGRIKMHTRAVEERIRDFDEVEESLTPEDALLEADRCLRCYRILLVAIGRIDSREVSAAA